MRLSTKIISGLGIGCLLTCSIVQGQELISNGDFSANSKTPNGISQIERSNGWENANRGTADYYHTDGKCKNSIPDNSAGQQKAFSGNGYAGIIAYVDDASTDWKEWFLNEGDGLKPAYNQYSEYVQHKLNQPLTAGQQYDVSFQVSLSENSGRAVNNIGAHFSKKQLSSDGNSFVKAQPQIVSDAVLQDKENWTTVSGRFTATGGEEYITIGLFNEADQIVTVADNKQTTSRKAYYYIDGISLVPFNEPDTDNDGVIDKNDDCPNEAGPASLDGCPDTDGDGLADINDECPKQSGPTDQGGCPDTDKDGIVDIKDKCPEVAGIPANKGCPEIKEETKEVFKKALKGIQFQSGRDVIKSSSYKILNDVADIMKENPAYQLTINGHTDSQGKDELNLELSEKRAAAVKKYLVDKNVEASRMETHGYGETKPIASNDTSTGRAKNRRVEFIVVF